MAKTSACDSTYRLAKDYHEQAHRGLSCTPGDDRPTITAALRDVTRLLRVRHPDDREK